MTQPGVELVPRLCRAGQVEVLDDVRCAFQHQHHHAFELGRRNGLHMRVVSLPRAATFWPAGLKSALARRTVRVNERRHLRLDWGATSHHHHFKL
jgi:hypothetical protein